MSKKLTESELYIQQAIESHGGLKELTMLSVDSAMYLSDLRAKEAVEKFARELIEKYGKDYKSRVDERIIVSAVRSEHIKHLAKQHGVEL